VIASFSGGVTIRSPRSEIGATVTQSQIVLLAAVLGLAAAVLWRRLNRARRVAARQKWAIAEFSRRRSELEGEFLAAASASGKPRGLRWKTCRLEGPPLFAADRASGELYALMGVTVSFEAVPGGGMEEVEAVGHLRAATAVFACRHGDWTTDGRVVFNLDPAGALAHYRESLAPVAES
jgi:hypothetical protein